MTHETLENEFIRLKLHAGDLVVLLLDNGRFIRGELTNNYVSSDFIDSVHNTSGISLVIPDQMKIIIYGIIHEIWFYRSENILEIRKENKIVGRKYSLGTLV